jgi:hypothetical protein
MDSWIINHLFSSDVDTITIVGMGEKRNLFRQLQFMFETEMVDYDIKFKKDTNVICKDIIFDDHVPGECIINFACEKMWPVGEIYKGRELILIGDDQHHNGDCNPITSHEQLIEQNNMVDVYHKDIFKSPKGYNHRVVYGCN